jgi:hypothetical protein
LLQFDTLYGKKAAALYTQAGDYQKTARFYYKKAEDTYYQVSLDQSFTLSAPVLRATFLLAAVHFMFGTDDSL